MQVVRARGCASISVAGGGATLDRGRMNSVYFNGLDNPKDDIIVEKVETTRVVDALRIATSKVLAQRNPKAKAYVYVDDERGCIEVCKTRFLRRIRYILH